MCWLTARAAYWEAPLAPPKLTQLMAPSSRARSRAGLRLTAAGDVLFASCRPDGKGHASFGRLNAAAQQPAQPGLADVVPIPQLVQQKTMETW